MELHWKYAQKVGSVDREIEREKLVSSACQDFAQL